MKLCPELPPTPLRTMIEKFAQDHSNLEEPYYAEDECWDISVKFVRFVGHALDGMLELRLVGVGDHPPYKRYCGDKADHWVIAAGEWMIDFTARQFHRWFAFPRVWREPKRKGKKIKNEKVATDGFTVPLRNQLYR